MFCFFLNLMFLLNILNFELNSTLPWFIIVIPFFSFFISFCAHSVSLGSSTSKFFFRVFFPKLASWFIFVNFLLVVCLLVQLNNYPYYYIFFKLTKFHWISSWPFVLIDWEFYMDNLTLWMLFAINGISCLVHFYSRDYMKTDLNLVKFMSYLSLFTFFMVVLVSANNFVLLFLGWEGVGLCSFLLISFWHTRVQANKAAIKALIVNRVADFTLTIGILLIYFIFKTVSFPEIFLLTPFFKFKTIHFFNISFNAINLPCLFLFFGAMGKSAQFGLHTWLPDAMEGPTPVSALIHAATMVTAGVFLLIKCSFLFEQAHDILLFISICGAFTSIFAATSALVQSDIKKVIAYSTCSQLGYMIFVCGLSGYNIGLFHLVNHAVFKALLFLAAGSIIHSVSNEQDMRRFGGILKLVPYTACVLFVGSLALVGFPFLAGYYSKDVILETAYSSYTISSSFCYTVGLLTAFFTSYYSYRVVHLTFICKTNLYKTVISAVHDSPRFIYGVMFILSVGSIVIGYSLRDMFIGMGSSFFTQSIFIGTAGGQVNSELTMHTVKVLPFFFLMISVLIVNYVFFVSVRPKKLLIVRLYNFLSHKWYFDVLYNKYLNIPLLQKSRVYLFELGDKGLLEFFGPLSTDSILSFTHNSIKKFLISDVVLYGLFIVLIVVLAM